MTINNDYESMNSENSVIRQDKFLVNLSQKICHTVI